MLRILHIISSIFPNNVTRQKLIISAKKKGLQIN